MSEPYWVPMGGGGGAMTKLFDSILAADAPNIDIPNIPASYAHLRLFIYARTDEANVVVALNVRFNNDSGANYDAQLMTGVGTTVAAAEALAQTSVRVGSAPAAQAAPNLFGACTVDIPHYANTTSNKATDGNAAVKVGTATGNLYVSKFAGFWRSNAAINRITVLAPTSPNLKAGTRVTLYGLS